MVLYQPQEIIGKSVWHLINEIRNIADKLVIVCNWNLSCKLKIELEKYSEQVIIRENKGFDAGAYRHALIKCIGKAEIRKYDELLICNDTFIGPFQKITNIFEEMEEKKCHFWGLDCVDIHLCEYIASYFYVFRKSVIQSDDFWEYWERRVDSEEMDINNIYVRFEYELSLELKRKGFEIGSFSKINHIDPYKDAYHVISDEKVPVIKKKAFSSQYYDKENVLCALSYIRNTTGYDIAQLLQWIKEEFQIEIAMEDIQKIEVDKANIPLKQMNVSKVGEEEIYRYSKERKYYIYGCGVYARLIYRNYVDKSNFLGFVESDECRTYQQCEGVEVIPFSKLKCRDKNCGIIIAVAKSNTGVVREKLGEYKDIMELW